MPQSIFKNVCPIWVQVHIDDILVPGKTPEKHDQRLWKVLQCLRQAKLTLKREKCSFRQPRVHFLGHVIDGNGVLANPEKTKAIRELPAPTSISQLMIRRCMGMINQLNKFSPQIAQLSQPLRELLSLKRVFLWTRARGGIRQSQRRSVITESISTV